MPSAIASCLEVVAEGEVTQHLEECAVTGCLTDILDIAGTDALLASGDSCVCGVESPDR